MGRAALDYLPHYTLEDYDRWEGDWELIDGVPFAMAPSPTSGHQRMGKILLMEMEEQLADCGACELFYELDWRINEDTAVRPDLLVVCHQTIDEYVHEPPHLIVEILSPRTASYDRHLKSSLYARQGVTFLVLADPQTGGLEAYRLEDVQYRRFEGPDFTLIMDKDCHIQLPETIDM